MYSQRGKSRKYFTNYIVGMSKIFLSVLCHKLAQFEGPQVFRQLNIQSFTDPHLVLNKSTVQQLRSHVVFPLLSSG